MVTALQKTTASLCLLALLASPLANVVTPAKPDTVQEPPSSVVQSAGHPGQPDIKTGISPPAAIQPPFIANSNVSTEQPNPAVNLSKGATRQEDRILTRDGQVFPIREYKPLINPNDTYANQWWVAPNGMNAVWDIPYGARQTKVAIIDTGFALNHQEFSGRWAINAGESGVLASNGIDDDNNGLIDDWRGWDFTGNDNNVQAGQTNPSGSGTTHGTMTTGVLGATGNNGVGIAGVNWYSTILPIQALNDNAYGDSYTVGESIYYAADQGADVISISLGTSADDPYLRLAIRYAMDRGAIVVAAAGNDGCNCISYPANYPEVIAVGAVDSSGNPASFSSYGPRLDVVAPGASITTSYWTPGNGTSGYVSNAAGTSFATPFVSGLLGLARSYQPDATWDEIIGAMFENSDRRSLTAAAPRSDTLGYGVARASTMLARLRTPALPVLRYQFGGAPYFGSARSYQCDTTLPGSLLYELTKPNQLRYTISPFQNYKATLDGWTSREAFYTCTGLPTDVPSSLRTINLPAETKNLYFKP